MLAARLQGEWEDHQQIGYRDNEWRNVSPSSSYYIRRLLLFRYDTIRLIFRIIHLFTLFWFFFQINFSARCLRIVIPNSFILALTPYLTSPLLLLFINAPIIFQFYAIHCTISSQTASHFVAYRLSLFSGQNAIADPCHTCIRRRRGKKSISLTSATSDKSKNKMRGNITANRLSRTIDDNATSLLIAMQTPMLHWISTNNLDLVHSFSRQYDAWRLKW